MGQKDITEKLLEDYNDVFADIVNVLLFQGRRVIGEDDLSQAKVRSQYKADDSKMHEQERDVFKIWHHAGLHIAMVGFENQTKVDCYMPIRVLGYDGAAYRSMLLSAKTGNEKNCSNEKLYPVITLVLYFGDTPWDEARTLYECIEVPEELKPFVSDYRINIFDIAYLSDEQVNMFQSDFRHIAEYYVQKRRTKDYHPSGQIIRHVDELMKMFSVLTGDNRYIKQGEWFEKEGGRVTMCEVLDKIEARGEARGKVMMCLQLGFSTEEIVEKTGFSLEKVKQILDELKSEES